MQYHLPTLPLEPIINHWINWHNCQRCPLAKTRHLVVLWKGVIPCQILFVGEGPGHTEDVEGFPFVGESGSLLTDMLLDATKRAGLNQPPVYAVTNIVACMPVKTNGELRPPNITEVQACRPRLLEFLKLAQPKILVSVGEVASIFSPFQIYNDSSSVPLIHREIIHPAALIRKRERHEFSQAYWNTVTDLAGIFELARGMLTNAHTAIYYRR